MNGQEQQYSDVLGYEEEVTATTDNLPRVRKMSEILSNATSVSAIQNILRNYSPNSFANQTLSTEPETRHGNSEQGIRYMDSKGEFQVRIGRLPTAGPPPISEPEDATSSASSSPASEGAVRMPDPKPSLKVILKISTLKQRNQHVYPLWRPELKTKAIKQKIGGQCPKMFRAARNAAAAKRVAKEAAKHNEKEQRKLRRKTRKIRKQQLILDMQAFQEEIIKTDAELTRLIAEGKEKIARIQERQQVRKQCREAKRELKRAKLRMWFKVKNSELLVSFDHPICLPKNH